MAVAERVLHILAKTTEIDEVRDDLDLPLYELHILDSLTTVGVLLAISDELGVAISPADLEREQWATPRRIVADIERRLEAKGGLHRQLTTP
jgi:D-alanine--poly(phosphoribitol) ligase subunit 2